VKRSRVLSIIGPGLLVAATGVGAGDLATAAFTGSELGVSILWAVLAGAFFKFVLNEGLARWQLATGTTLCEGAVQRLGRAVAWIFLPYLFLWSVLVGSALMGACGVTFHALVPLFEDAGRAKIILGIAHSLVGLLIVLLGGFRLFEKVMGACIGIMFATVVVTAIRLWPGTGEVLRGLLVPDPASLRGEGLSWTVALMGGVGGTVTVLCYGYWIREKGREGMDDLKISRIDLAVGYGMTAIFGLAMVITGSRLKVEGRGATLVVNLAEVLRENLGPTGMWVFLLGAWCAVFSSLLGVWQAVPYLFADFWGHLRKPPAPADTGSLPYRIYLILIAIVPMAGLLVSFREMQKLYAITGACFIPLLALALLILNGRRDWVGDRFRNRWPTVLVLVTALAFFGWILLKALAG